MMAICYLLTPVIYVCALIAMYDALDEACGHLFLIMR